MALLTRLSASVQWAARAPHRRKRVRRSCFCCVLVLLFYNAFGTGVCLTSVATPQTRFFGSFPEVTSSHGDHIHGVSSPLVSESSVPVLCDASSSARPSLDARCEGCLPTAWFLPAFAVPSPPRAARLHAATQAFVNLNTEARGASLLSSPVHRSAEVRHQTAFASPWTPTLHGCRTSSRIALWAHAGKTSLSDPSDRGSFSKSETASCLGSLGSQGSPSSRADWDKTLFTTHVRPTATTRGTRKGTRSHAISASAVASSPAPRETEGDNTLRETGIDNACAEFNVNGEGRGDAVGREGRRRSLREMRCDGTPYVGLVTQILPPPLSAGRQLWPLAVVDIGCMRSGTLELRPHWDIRVGDLVPVKVASVDFVRHRLVLQLDSSAKERFFQKFRGPNTWLKGTVAQILPFGAVVNLAPGIDGLLHVSRFPPLFENSAGRQVKPRRSRPSVKERVRIGDEIQVCLVMFDRDRLVLAAQPYSSLASPSSRAGFASPDPSASPNFTAASDPNMSASSSTSPTSLAISSSTSSAASFSASSPTSFCASAGSGSFSK